MKFTDKTLKYLKDSGKEVGAFSKDAREILKKHNYKEFSYFQNRSYYYWVSGKRAIPLSIILRIMREHKLKEIKLDFLSVGGGNKIKFPDNISDELCYLVGLILGDGCLVHSKRNERKNTYYIQISFKNIKKAEEIQNLVTKLFEIKSPRYKGRGCFNIYAFSKPLVMLLNKEYEIPIGEKYNLLKVPKKIKNSNSKKRRFFAKGVFESDGNIYFHRGKKAIQLRQKSQKFLNEIRELLKKENLEFNKPYRDNANNSWLLWSSKKELVDNFIKKIVNLELKPE